MIALSDAVALRCWHTDRRRISRSTAEQVWRLLPGLSIKDEGCWAGCRSTAGGALCGREIQRRHKHRRLLGGTQFPEDRTCPGESVSDGPLTCATGGTSE